MWSRRFLWTGLSSGVAIAALTLAELWLGLFVVSGSKDPTWTFANIVKFALPGLIVYSACWYIVIFRHRDYSLYRTLMLVVATFGTVSVVIAAVMILAGFYVAITLSRSRGSEHKNKRPHNPVALIVMPARTKA
jgi:hypothetical protein